MEVQAQIQSQNNEQSSNSGQFDFGKILQEFKQISDGIKTMTDRINALEEIATKPDKQAKQHNQTDQTSTQLQELQKKLAEKEAEALKTRAESEFERQILQISAQKNVADPELFGVAMRKFTQLKDGKYIPVVDGKEWDQSGNTYDFSKVADLVLKEKPFLIKNSTIPGAGTSKGETGSGNVLTAETINSMSNEEFAKNRAELWRRAREGK